MNGTRSTCTETSCVRVPAARRVGLAVLLWACGPMAFAFAAEYYVSPNGADTNSGAIGAPFKTLQKARDVVRTVNTNMAEDLVVYMRGGWYSLASTLTFDQNDSGMNGYNVIYRAYPGESPVISGGRLLTGWTLHDAAKNIWKAAATNLETRQLYVNCVRAVRSHSGSGLPGAVRTASGYTTSDAGMQNWGNPGDIEFVYNGLQGGTGGSLWTERRVGVASISGTTITMKAPAFTWALSDSDAYQRITNPTDIENAYELLDQPGEWYLDRSAAMLYYIPRAGEDMASARVVAPVVETLVSGTGVFGNPLHNVQFVGITFAHATWLRPNTTDGFAEIQANYCRGYGWTPANVVFRTAQNLSFNRCVFKHLGAIGLELSGGSQSNAVEGCVFTDISGICIRLGDVDDPVRSDTRARDAGNRVVNSYIHDSPCEYHGGCGIMAGYVADTVISKNEIANLSYTAVSVGWGWGTSSYAAGNQVTSNKIHNFVQMLGDGGGLYTLSAQPNSVEAYNWYQGMPSRPNGGAIYPDEGSAYYDIHHNVCSSVARWLFIWTPSIHDINVHDNYSDTSTARNDGTNIGMSNNVVVSGGNWRPSAVDIMNNAGIESAFADVRSRACACSLTEPGPSVPPELVSVSQVSDARVAAVFSRKVDPVSAQAIGNYAIAHGIVIVGATLDSAGKAVTLTTSGMPPLVEGTTYTLTVNNVGDRSSPEMVIAPDTKKTFKADRGGGGPLKMRIAFPGYSRGEALTNFPALVVFSTNMAGSGFAYSQVASPNGWDIRFKDETETMTLNYEIERWDTNGNSYVWVQVPRLTNGASIWAYWGNTNLADAPPAYTTDGATWSEGYVAVWHMTQTNTLDSSSSRYNGTSAGNTNATGYVGTGQSFNQTDSLAFSGLDWRPTRFSVSFWLNPNSRADWNQQVVAVNGWGAFVFHTTANGGIYCGITVDDSCRFTPTQTGNNVLNVGSWNYWTFTCDALLSANLFRDGTKLVGPRTQQSPTTAWGGFRVNSGGAAAGLDGLVDEVRVSSADRSANWTWAEWLNMASNTVFNTHGTVTANPETDAYGIPNWWKIQFWGSTDAPGSGALEDGDGDGMNNFAEWKAGACPTNVLSVLRLMQPGVASVTNFVVPWQGVEGRSYTIECSTNLPNGFPFPVLTNIPGVDGVNVRTVIINQASAEYFRVKVE